MIIITNEKKKRTYQVLKHIESNMNVDTNRHDL